jgi:hypothetical protein
MIGTQWVADVGRHLSSLFSEPSRASSTTGTPSRRPSDAGRHAALNGNGGEPAGLDELRKILESGQANGPMQVGRLSLKAVRTRLGAAWPHYQQTVHDVTRRAITRHVGGGAAFVPLDADQYFLVLPAGSGVLDLAARMKLAAAEISRLLFGDEGSADLLDVTTSTIAGTGSGDPDPAQPAPPSAAEPGAAAAKAEARANPWATDGDPLAQVGAVYRPMWDARRQVIRTYICVPAMRQASGRLLVGESGIPRMGEAEIVQRLDEMIAYKVLTDLRSLMLEEKWLMLGVPVHFETLGTWARRQAYFKPFEALPQAARAMLLFELIGAPDGVPQGRLLELSSSLRRLGRGVFLRAPLVCTTFRSPAETGLIGIGSDLSEAAGSEGTIMRAMDHFNEAAQKVGFRTYVHGARSTSLAIAAVASGYNFIDGDAVSTVMGAPDRSKQFELVDLFAPAARQNAALALRPPPSDF